MRGYANSEAARLTSIKPTLGQPSLTFTRSFKNFHLHTGYYTTYNRSIYDHVHPKQTSCPNHRRRTRGPRSRPSSTKTRNFLRNFRKRFGFTFPRLGHWYTQVCSNTNETRDYTASPSSQRPDAVLAV